jgi:hypothetical protein
MRYANVNLPRGDKPELGPLARDRVTYLNSSIELTSAANIIATHSLPTPRDIA